MDTQLNLEQFALDVFNEAQKIAPEASGQLKESARLMTGSEGFAIIYDTPYAYNLHQGIQQPESVIQHVSNIPAHRRQLKGRTVVIREHKKTYKKGFKPVQIKKGGTYIGKSGDVWKTRNNKLITRRKNQIGWVQQAYRNIRDRFAFHQKTAIPKEILIRQYPTQKATSSGGIALIATIGGTGKNMQQVTTKSSRIGAK